MYVEQATDKLVAITLCPDDGTTSSYFEKLPLDCLFEIYRYLSPLDVANASEAMSFLSDFAKENIYKKYADGQMFRAGENWYWDDFHCVVRNFGEYFKRITLHSWNCYADDDYGEYNNNIFFVALVLRHCPNLEELRVLGFAWNKYTFRVLGKEHCAARKLFIRCWTFQFKLHELLAQWPKVKDLSIDFDNHGINMVYVERFKVINAEVSSSNVCSFGNNNLTHLTLINVRNLTDYFYKGVKNWRSLERLQISVNSPTDVFNLAGSNVKYLQLVGEFEPQSAWILPPMGFLQFLEELDLFRIDGRNVRVAACVPTLRVLNIHNSNIGKDDEFAETINKLPKLRRLRLRKSSVCPDDLVELIEINGSLTEIVLELPPKETVDLLIQSLNRSIQTSTNERCFKELLVVVAEIDVSILANRSMAKREYLNTILFFR